MTKVLFTAIAGANIGVALVHLTTGLPYDVFPGAITQLTLAGWFLMYAFRGV